MTETPITTHTVQFHPASALSEQPAESVDLVVTSPPYPMIVMWDKSFCEQDGAVAEALRADQPERAYELMHGLLDRVWREAARVLKPGGVACINIGDAARTIGGSFRLFPNHARIIEAMLGLGMQNLPNIIWRKPTNAPNKFMGSGMLPPGAYVTLEHEYVLIFRKGGKREFRTAEEKARRAGSAIFWEERNRWYSDVWFDLVGAHQKLAAAARTRSGAFPFELAWRLVNMFSIKGDMVLDPFAGTGTTMMAAAVSERNSMGYEIEVSLLPAIEQQIVAAPSVSRQVVTERIRRHLEFVRQREAEGKELKFCVERHGWPCVSGQERGMVLRVAEGVERGSGVKRGPKEPMLRCAVRYREVGEDEQITLPLQ